MNTRAPKALLAEDEPLLAQALRAELRKAWPELDIADTVADGQSAVQRALQLQPDVLFFDIRMPGMNGIDAATALADAWDASPGSQKPFPVLVFVTAFDQYAVQAFEAQALDYVLKPVNAERLVRTVARARSALDQRLQVGADPQSALVQAVAQLRGLLEGNVPPLVSATERLQVIQASVTNAQGTRICLVPIADVVYFEAADKYLRVLTREQEYLIRTSLRELLAQLDPEVFWQVHRGTVVRCTDIESVTRDEAGRTSLSLRSRPERLPVSRLYAHLFKPM